MATGSNDIEYFVYPDGEELYLVDDQKRDPSPLPPPPPPPPDSTRPAGMISNTDLSFLNDQGDILIQSTPYREEEYAVGYITVTDSKLLDLISEIIDEVNAIANLPYTVTRMLLAHFNWDKETLLDRYYACTDDPQCLNKLLEDAHIANTESICDDETAAPPVVGQGDSETCAICLEPFSHDSSASLNCGHSFCKCCWVMYLTEKILDQGEAHYISCPDTKCHVLVDDRKVLSLIDDPVTRSTYIKLIIDQFVAKNKRLRWCPSGDCANAIELSEIVPASTYCLPVSCGNCHNSFCFHCQREPHEPVSCTDLKKWHEKCEDKDHRESLNYINANTKDCPKCNVAIEKNGGCNHMTCRKCRFEFCWLCLRPFDHSSYTHAHKCNSYQEELSSKILDARAQLKRFLHYCDRYLNHDKSRDLEKKLIAKVEEMKEEYVAQKIYSIYELSFLDQGIAVLQKCRKTLMYTYAFAFFIEVNNQQIIFEQNQLDLETSTEKLSNYLENSLKVTDDPKEVKIRTVDHARYCESRRRVLITHVKEGFDKGWWQYRN